MRTFAVRLHTEGLSFGETGRSLHCLMLIGRIKRSGSGRSGWPTVGATVSGAGSMKRSTSRRTYCWTPSCSATVDRSRCDIPQSTHRATLLLRGRIARRWLRLPDYPLPIRPERSARLCPPNPHREMVSHPQNANRPLSFKLGQQSAGCPTLAQTG